MIQVCIICDRVYGEKEPLELRCHTHGLCMGCLKEYLRLHDKEVYVEGGESVVKRRSSRKEVLSQR